MQIKWGDQQENYKSTSYNKKNYLYKCNIKQNNQNWNNYICKQLFIVNNTRL